jgi:heat shock protein HslJ
MKNLTIALFVICILSLSACQQPNKDLENTQWQVIKLDSLTIPPGHVLDFKDNNKCYLHLDANSCHGDYTTASNNQVHFQMLACTEMCCDSASSVKLADILRKTREYEIKDSELLLKGEGLIQLTKVSK